MLKKITVFIFSAVLLLNVYGCIPIIAGAAGGAGTAIWLSGKLTEEFPYPYDRTVKAAKKALASLKLNITKETRDENVTQLRSEYTDGKDIWIDIRRVTESSTKVEVRVGAISSDEEASDKILKRIQRYL